MESNAVLSECGLYRYRLTRSWGEGERVLWIMLNPSTADHAADDPTIRRVIGFSQAWGFGSLEVVNLFAYRSPSPKDLPRVGWSKAEGPDNRFHLAEAAAGAALLVAAWGANETNGQAARVQGLFTRQLGRDLHVVHPPGETEIKPRHPLYLKAKGAAALWQRARVEVQP